MMSIAPIVLGKESGRSSLANYIIGLIAVGIGDCKVPSAYPCPISSKKASLQSPDIDYESSDSYSWSYWYRQEPAGSSASPDFCR